ncbi:hypothetical protein ACOME3_002804 [Neoechinorhynchus agilis]
MYAHISAFSVDKRFLIGEVSNEQCISELLSQFTSTRVFFIKILIDIIGHFVCSNDDDLKVEEYQCTDARILPLYELINSLLDGQDDVISELHQEPYPHRMIPWMLANVRCLQNMLPYISKLINEPSSVSNYDLFVLHLLSWMIQFDSSQVEIHRSSIYRILDVIFSQSQGYSSQQCRWFLKNSQRALLRICSVYPEAVEQRRKLNDSIIKSCSSPVLVVRTFNKQG